MEIDIAYDLLLEEFFRFEKIGDYSLDRMVRACVHFGNPEKSFRSIHIAGTNGKGSVSKMIFEMLKDQGKKVGVYTSPHNIDIRERFETENGLISKQDFIRYVREILAYGDGLSYFERCVLVAFLHFRDQGCEYAVIEVGLGWRLDATNAITPILSVITSISYDHMEFLGNTLESIAFEKGGIIKPGVPVILYGPNPTLEQLAEERNSRIIFSEMREISTNLEGEHQVFNARIAYEAGEFLGLSDAVIRTALMHVEHQWRLDYIRSNLLVDGAHNEDGLRKLRSYLEGIFPNWKKTVYGFNLKTGKSASLVLDTFPEVTDWIIVPGHIRVNDAKEMRAEVRSLWKSASIETPESIFRMSEENPDTLFVVFGSLYLMSEFLEKRL